MHPASSVIFFTTASGAGYGLLFLLAICGSAGFLPPDLWFGAFALGLALALISAGLLSSTFHLGRPERAWRAFSQWRSSWLSREGVAAVVTYIPAACFAIGWVYFGDTHGLFAWAGALTAIMSTVTVFCTGMIYASLKPIRQWNNRLTAPVYLALSLMTGALLLAFLTAIFGLYRPSFGKFVVVSILVAGGVKWAWRRAVDAEPARSTIGTATGLSALGEVRLLEMPHTEENFLMKEMGFRIARKHALRLWRIATLTLFVAPLILMEFANFAGGPAPLPCAALAVLSAAFGVAVERWLFFAEATHTSMLYYGRAA